MSEVSDGVLSLCQTDVDREVLRAHRADSPKYLSIRSVRQVALSHTGIIFGCCGTVIVAGLSLLLFAFHSFRQALCTTALVGGLWWAVLGVASVPAMRARKGIERADTNLFVVYSWRSMREVLSEMRAEYKQAFRFLLISLTYQGATNAMSSTGGRLVVRYCLSDVAVMSFVLADYACRAVGTFAAYQIRTRLLISDRTMLMSHLCVECGLAIWTAIGGMSDSDLFGSKVQLFVVTCIYGFNTGSLHSFQRTIFASMIPKHKESRFFATFRTTYEISSLFAYLLVVLVLQLANHLQVAMLVFAVMFGTGVILVRVFINVEEGMMQSGRRP